MRRCRVCGFPKRLSRSIEWHSDGTVAGSIGIKLPFMFLGVDERESIFDELSETIGFPIEHIIVEAQRNVGKELYDMVRRLFGNIDMRRIPSSRFLRPQWFAKFFMWCVRNQVASTGIGQIRVDSYRTGDSLVLRCSDACLVPALVGNCIGIYESLEKMPGAKADYFFDNGDLIIRLAHSEAEPESEKRFYLEEVRAGEGRLAYERCPRCAVPLMLARNMVFDIGRGIIMNLDSGEREGMVAVQSLFAVVRELERELGDEVVTILYDAQKRHSVDHLRARENGEPEDFWEPYVTDLAVRGMGHPVRFDWTLESVSVEIDNAYEQSLYAAKVAAGLEAMTGRESRIDWETREHHHARYTVSVA